MSAPAVVAILALTTHSALAPVSCGAEVQGPPASPIRVLEHALVPARPEAGASADERVVVWAPEAVSLSLSDGGPAGASVERLGSWWVARAPDEGGVRWTFTAPITAWAHGRRQGPELTLSHGSVGDSVRIRSRLAGIAFEAVSPLDGAADPGEPAPPEGTPPAPRWRWAALLALGVVIGGAAARSLVGGWRSSMPPLGPSKAGAVGKNLARAALREALAAAPHDPGAAVVALAQAVRAHPEVTGLGVTPAHTTHEVVARVQLDGVGDVLALADAVKYGGAMPHAEEVLAAGRRMAQALEGDGARHA